MARELAGDRSSRCGRRPPAAISLGQGGRQAPAGRCATGNWRRTQCIRAGRSPQVRGLCGRLRDRARPAVPRLPVGKGALLPGRGRPGISQVLRFLSPGGTPGHSDVYDGRCGARRRPPVLALAARPLAVSRSHGRRVAVVSITAPAERPVAPDESRDRTLWEYTRASGLRSMVMGTSKDPNAKLTILLV